MVNGCLVTKLWHIMFEPKYYHTSLPWCDLVVFLDRLLKVTQQSLSQRNTMIIHVEELVLVRPARSSTQFSANNTYLLKMLNNFKGF